MEYGAVRDGIEPAHGSVYLVQVFCPGSQRRDECHEPASVGCVETDGQAGERASVYEFGKESGIDISAAEDDHDRLTCHVNSLVQ